MTSPVHALTIAEAGRRFADVVERAVHRHETTLLLQDGVAVAHVAPVEPAGVSARVLAARWPHLPRLAAGEAEALAEDVAAARAALPAPPDPWA